jgi:Fe-S-cluster-containing dehydrogenase component
MPLTTTTLPKTGRMRKIIVCESEKCNGCQICEVVCAYTKEKVPNIKMSRISTVRIEPFLNIALSCRKCEKPSCVKACPRDAITVLEDGSISIPKDKCNGCGWCIESCEFGVLKLHFDNKVAVACDFCADLGEPQCVKKCPKGALSYITLEQVARKSSKEVAEHLISELASSEK